MCNLGAEKDKATLEGRDKVTQVTTPPFMSQRSRVPVPDGTLHKLAVCHQSTVQGLSNDRRATEAVRLYF